MTDQRDPTDEQVDQLINRTWALARAALANHPNRERALEMVEQGGGLLIRNIGPARFELFVGWVAGYVPPGEDPEEIVALVKLPRSAVFNGLDAPA